MILGNEDVLYLEDGNVYRLVLKNKTAMMFFLKNLFLVLTRLVSLGIYFPQQVPVSSPCLHSYLHLAFNLFNLFNLLSLPLFSSYNKATEGG